MDESLDLSLEFTPNPNTLKFVVNRILLDWGAASFTSSEQAQSSPLALRLFEIEGITGVMVGRNFITISKAENSDWDKIFEPAQTLIGTLLKSGEKIISEEYFLTRPATADNCDSVEAKIRQILDDEIRPAVAMDGGDITFEKFENGVVYLFLQGSCSGCPSSTMTLKMGIENRLKEVIPEVKEVVSI